MAILIKSKGSYYELTDKLLKKCKITKKQFESGMKKKKGADVAGQCWDDCSLVNLSSCCMDKASYWASC